MPGVLIDFISVPVTVGFTSATSVIIAVSQLPGLLGLKFKSSGFMDNLIQFFKNIGNTRVWDAGMSLSCIVVLLLLRVRFQLLINEYHRQLPTFFSLRNSKMLN